MVNLEAIYDVTLFVSVVHIIQYSVIMLKEKEVDWRNLAHLFSVICMFIVQNVLLRAIHEK